MDLRPSMANDNLSQTQSWFFGWLVGWFGVLLVCLLAFHVDFVSTPTFWIVPGPA